MQGCPRHEKSVLPMLGGSNVSIDRFLGYDDGKMPSENHHVLGTNI